MHVAVRRNTDISFHTNCSGEIHRILRSFVSTKGGGSGGKATLRHVLSHPFLIAPYVILFFFPNQAVLFIPILLIRLGLAIDGVEDAITDVQLDTA